MMFVFVDECRSRYNDRPYAAAVASIWEAQSLRPFREAFLSEIGSHINSDRGVIQPFPTIHAMEMAKEYDDETKLLCFEAIARLAHHFDVDFYRLGYFDDALLISNFKSLSLAISQLCALISSSIDDEIVFVYEFDISRHNEISRAFSDLHIHYHRTALGTAAISIKNTDLIIGRYYCNKTNPHMWVTDTASYVANAIDKIGEGVEPTPFRDQILSRTREIERRFVYNEIIQINDLPYRPSGDGPVRYAVPITPNDNEDLSAQFEAFLKRLEKYWTKVRDP